MRVVFPAVLLVNLALLGAYLALHPETVAFYPALIAMGQTAAKNWPGWHAFRSAQAGHIWSLAVCLALLWAVYNAGREVMGFCGLKIKNTQGGLAALCRMAAGLGVASLLVLGAGLAGLLFKVVLAVLFVSLFLPGLAAKARKSGVPRVPGLATGLMWGGVILLLLLDFTACLSFEWFQDSRAYHLGLPERYILNHKVFVMPENMLTLLPLNGEMLYLPALAFGGEVSAKLVNLGIGLLAVLAGAALARRLIVPDGGWGAAFAALLVVSMPLAMIENEAVFGDNLRAFWETMALVMFIRARGTLGPSLLASASLMGLAMGGKYLSVIRGGLLAAALFLPWLTGGGRTAPGRRAGAMAFFVAIGSVVLGPWLLRNFLTTGDPVYPFGLHVFGSLRFTPAELSRWIADNRHYGVEGMTFASWLSLPVRLAMDLREGEFGTFTTGPLVLGLIVLAAFRRAWPPWPGLVLLLCLAEWVFWSLSSHMVRYLFPALVSFCALAGWGAQSLSAKSAGWRRMAAALAGVWLLGSVMLRVHHRFNLDSHFGILGFASGRLTVSDAREARGYGRNINILGPGRILLVAEDKVLGIGREWKATSIYNTPLVEQWALESADSARFGIKVRQSGVKTILVNGDGYNALKSRGDLDMPEGAWKALNGWWTSNLRVAFKDPPWTGFVVVDNPSRRR